MGHFDGKVVVVTGAGQGLGRAYALAFAKEGAKVVVNDLGGSRDGQGQNTRVADEVVELIKKEGGQAVANYDSVASLEGGASIVKSAMDAFGRIDILVNNAGILRDKTLFKMEEPMWDVVIDVHLKGTFACTKAAAEIMKDQGYGRIINTSSYAGLKGNFGQTNYAAAKGGIYSMTLVWALELGKFGITVNCIAPMAKTRLTEDISMIPDTMKVEHVASMVTYLASDLAGNVNGRVFGIHGGQLFEYKMDMTPGVEKKEGFWTIEEIDKAMPQIGKSASAGAAGGADAGVKNELKEAFTALLEVFTPAKAEGWTANIHFVITGGEDWTLNVQDKKATTAAGLNGKPTCTVNVDAATITGVLRGTTDPQQAFMAGKIKADKLSDMMKFGAAFDLKAGNKGGAKPAAAPVAMGTASAGGFNKAMLGTMYRMNTPFAVTAELASAYAWATNAENPRYTGKPGLVQVAPPIFPVRVMKDMLFEVLTDQRLNLNLLMLVHGEQDMRFMRHLKPGDKVTAMAKVIGCEDKETGELVRVGIRMFAGNELACEMLSSFFIRNGKKKTSSDKEVSEAPALSAPFSYSTTVAADQTHRYAEASGDDNPIHLDPDTAKSAGLPNIILQGLCTMAFASNAIVEKTLEGDPTRLRRLAVRFSKPVFPGDTVTVQGGVAAKNERLTTLNFVATNQKGDVVLANGIAELARG